MCDVMKAIDPKWADVNVDSSFKGCDVLVKGMGRARYIAGDGMGKAAVRQNGKEFLINKSSVICVICTAADIARLGKKK